MDLLRKRGVLASGNLHEIQNASLGVTMPSPSKPRLFWTLLNHNVGAGSPSGQIALGKPKSINSSLGDYRMQSVNDILLGPPTPPGMPVLSIQSLDFPLQ